MNNPYSKRRLLAVASLLAMSLLAGCSQPTNTATATPTNTPIPSVLEINLEQFVKQYPLLQASTVKKIAYEPESDFTLGILKREGLTPKSYLDLTCSLGEDKGQVETILAVYANAEEAAKVYARLRKDYDDNNIRKVNNILNIKFVCVDTAGLGETSFMYERYFESKTGIYDLLALRLRFVKVCNVIVMFNSAGEPKDQRIGEYYQALTQDLNPMSCR
jgi:hypothetical protein